MRAGVRAVGADAAQVLVDQVLELRPPPLEAGRGHVGDVVGDHLDVGLLGLHPGAGDIERAHAVVSFSCLLRQQLVDHRLLPVALGLDELADELELPQRHPSSASSPAPAARWSPRSHPARCRATPPASVGEPDAEQRVALGRELHRIGRRAPRRSLPSWPFSLDTVPSPAMVICVSVGDSWIGWPLVSSSGIAGAVGQRAVGHQAEAPVAGQPRAARRADGEIAVAGDAQGRTDCRCGSACRRAARARSRGPACRRWCARRAADRCRVWRLSQSLNCTRSALKPGVLALAMLSAITSMARCCATRREAATLLMMSMPVRHHASCVPAPLRGRHGPACSPTHARRRNLLGSTTADNLDGTGSRHDAVASARQRSADPAEFAGQRLP